MIAVTTMELTILHQCFLPLVPTVLFLSINLVTVPKAFGTPSDFLVESAVFLA